MDQVQGEGRPVSAADDELRFYERIVASTPDHISVVDRGYVYRTVNPAYLAAHGRRREEIVGRSVAELLGQDVFERVVRPKLDECLAGRTVQYRAWFEFAAAGRRFMSVTYYPYRDALGEVQGVVVSARNETDLVRAEEALREKEEQLLHAQKMEAIGRLAGGVAHDFNNLLTVILGYCEVLLRRKAPEHPDREFLEEIQAASERASNLTRQLLTFSRKQVTRPRLLDLNAVIVDLGRLLRRVIGEDVALETRLAAEGRIAADRGQLEQVLLNLAVNARDAMPGGGRLSIETSDVQVDQAAAAGTPLLPGPHVLLTVSDTGHGMDADTRARAFEPFFTTKPLGKGTGLGLPTVYGIVHQCGGWVDVISEPGAGATFRILLPAAAASASEAGSTGSAAPPGGTETILLVEDDVSVRRLVERLLTGNGYQVLVAADPLQAMQLSRGHARPIDLLLTDLVMPHMGGRALADALRAERPGLKVLLMSGYADEGGLEAAADARRDDAFIQKPLRSEQLLERLRQALAGRT